jgi:outer membrane protein TolC
MNKRWVARTALKSSAACLAAWMLGASLATAAEPPLTLAEAQRRAIERSTALKAQDAAASASREMAVAAARLPDPVATLGINNLPVDGPDAWSVTSDFMTMRSVGLMQEFTGEDKRRARAERFERQADQSAAEKTVRLTTIRRDTAVAWLDRYYVEAQLEVLDAQTRQARLEIEAAETAYRAGRGALAEVLAARGALVSLDDRASELARRRSTARIALARWIGDAADLPLAGKPAIDAIEVDPRKLDSQLEHEPQVAMLSSQEQVADAEVKEAQSNKKPDWTVQVMYSLRGPSFSNMISVGVSVPLQWDQANRQDREVAAKLALLDRARAEREDMLRARAAELRALLAEWQSDRERRVRYERELIPLAAERTQAMLAAYRGLKASLNELLLARRNEIDVRLQALQLEMDTARVWAQLAFAFPGHEAESAASDPLRHSQ